jgi:hypothetical protein
MLLALHHSQVDTYAVTVEGEQRTAHDARGLDAVRAGREIAPGRAVRVSHAIRGQRTSASEPASQRPSKVKPRHLNPRIIRFKRVRPACLCSDKSVSL